MVGRQRRRLGGQRMPQVWIQASQLLQGMLPHIHENLVTAALALALWACRSRFGKHSLIYSPSDAVHFCRSIFLSVEQRSSAVRLRVALMPPSTCAPSWCTPLLLGLTRYVLYV